MISKILFLTFAALIVVGCGEPVPENPKSTNGANPNVQGTPRERIKMLEADTTLPPEERARRIQVIKDRNHLP